MSALASVSIDWKILTLIRSEDHLDEQFFDMKFQYEESKRNQKTEIIQKQMDIQPTVLSSWMSSIQYWARYE